MKNIVKIFVSIVLLIGFTFAQDADTLAVEEEDSVTQTQLEIQAQEDEVNVGDSLDLQLVYIDSTESIDTTADQWSVEPDSLGTFDDDDNVFVAEDVGKGKLIAEVDTFTAEYEIEVVESEEEQFTETELEIKAQDDEVNVGDSLDLQLLYDDSTVVNDTTTVQWAVEPDSLGTFSENVFIAGEIGKGKIIAEVDTLTAEYEIEVVKPEQEDSDQEENELDNDIVISPKDTIVNVNNDIDFNISYKTDSSIVDTVADTWSLKGMEIGSITSDGVLTADTTGYALVQAKLGDRVQTGFVIVQNEANDDTLNTVEIEVPHPAPNKEYKTAKTVQEGEKWVIGGMKPPLHIYNGGMVYFPVGSLDEDIKLRINTPDFAKLQKKGDSVEVSYEKEDLVSALEFNVYVDDSLQEPYYFNSSLIVGLVYKRGLLKQMNLDPHSLRLRYANQQHDSSIQYESEGIENSTNDYHKNRIFSGVAHFSTLAIEGETKTTNIADGEQEPDKQEFKLHQNYPNPFNPTTNIKFRLPSKAKVNLTVYNILGQKVTTLTKSEMSAGTHILKWNASDLSSGIYLIRLSTDQHSSVTKAVLTK